MRTQTLTLATLLGAILVGSTVFASVFTTNRSAQDSPAPSVPAVDATPRLRASDGSILLGDGVRARPSVTISQDLFDPATNESVRCLSFFCVFTGQGGRLLARTTSQRVLPAGSFDSIQIELGGVDPTLDEVSAASFPSATDHKYLITISPDVDLSWAQVSRDEVVIDIVRVD